MTSFIMRERSDRSFGCERSEPSRQDRAPRRDSAAERGPTACYTYFILRYLIGQEAVFLTILREPVSQFESLFTYYKLEGPMPIQEYISKR